MKKILFIINICLIALAYLAWRYYRSTPPRGDYTIYASSIKSKIKKTGPIRIVSQPDLRRTGVQKVIKSNPFDPQRGIEKDSGKEPVVKTSPGNSQTLNLRLTGICKVDGKMGAIIIDRAIRHNFTPRTLTRRGRMQTHRGQEKLLKPTKSAGYYQVDDELPNGYILKEVKKNSVILVKGSNRFELKMGEGDSENKAAAVQLPPKNIISASENSRRAPNVITPNRITPARRNRMTGKSI